MKKFYSRQRGIHLVTWQGVLALAFFPTVFVARFPIETLKVDPGQLILALVIAQAAIGGLLLIADKTIFKNTANPKIWIASLVTLFAAGFTFVFSVRFFVSQTSGVKPTLDNLIHLSVMSIGYVFWMILIAVAVSNTEKYRASFEMLQRKIAEQKAVEFEQAIRLDAVKNEVATELVSSLSISLDETPGEGTPSALKVKLIDLNENILRPLARALSQRPLTQTNLLSSKLFDPVQKTSALSALQRIGNIGPFDYKFAPILAAAISYFAKSWMLPSHLALLSVLISYLILFSLLFITSRVHRQFGNLVEVSHRPVVFSLAFALIIVVDMTVLRLLFGEHELTVVLAVISGESMAIIFAGLIRGTAIERERVLRELEAQAEKLKWAVARTGQLIWVEHQRLSKLLHGDIQSKIVAMANNLGQTGAAVVAGQQRFDALIADCISAISEPVQRQSLQSFVSALTELWAASLKIEMKLEERARARLRFDPDAEASIEEIIRECITNAAKHGNAKNVSIEISAPESMNELVEIKIANDGKPIEGDSKKGQGSRIMDQVTLQWSRISGENKTITWALVPTK